MPELRQNIITREWVIIAKERAKRPHQFVRPPSSLTPLPSYDAECPFCVGNEHMTVHETYRVSGDKGWKVRVVMNKYPALSPEGDRLRHVDGIYRSMSGVGAHEVIIEHPRHNATPALFSVMEMADVIATYRQRYTELQKDPRIEAVIVFKNHGEGAGTSLPHPHAQVAAMPIVPSQIRQRMEEAIRYFDETGECVFCTSLRHELQARQRIIAETPHFVAFTPYAALSPFHLWIFPRRHNSSFGEIFDHEVTDFAEILRTVLAKLYYGLNDPDFNYSIRSSLVRDGQREYFHWYLAIIPRIARTAGFEIGSGMYINPSLPEESAQFLREVQIPAS
jgi:UDPglucose--hexose-1-phosphate uridylyltransferase